jgi:hypothetical protein
MRTATSILYYVRVQQATTDKPYPPAAEELLANVTAIRELLLEVLPPALTAAIAVEQAETMTHRAGALGAGEL